MSTYTAVIVGTDGSVTAGRAVQRAALLAQQLETPLLVATAYHRTDAGDAGPPSVRAQMARVDWQAVGYRAASDVSREGAAVARKVAPNVIVDTAVPPGEPASALLELAEDREGGLLVVGNIGLAGAGRFLLGNVPNKIIHHPVGDVLIVATAESSADPVDEGDVRSVLVGTDGSRTATIALDRALELASAAGADVTVITVGPSDWAQEVLDKAAARAAAAGVDVKAEHLVGDPASVILDRAGAFDLVVVGNRGMTGAARFLLGSVPNKVSHHTTTDLLIVKTT